jgi:hypothetical protein
MASLLSYAPNSTTDPNKAGLVADEIEIFVYTLGNVRAAFDWAQQYGSEDLGEVTMFGDGCATPEGFNLNCTDVCSNSTLLFRTWQSQYSCIALAAVSVASTLYPNISAPYIDATNRVASQVAIPNITAFDGEGVLNATYQCARASCTNDESFGTCSATDIFGVQAPDTALGLYLTLLDEIKSLCDTVSDTPLDPDIGGPGVSFLANVSPWAQRLTIRATYRSACHT